MRADQDTCDPREVLADIMSGFATDIAARYGHPVYLVGSALSMPAEAVYTVRLPFYDLRDVDVVCVLPDDEFRARFGGDWQYCQGGLAQHGRWAAEVGKLSKNASQYFGGLNVDFKVQSESWVAARHAGKPRIRLDRHERPANPPIERKNAQRVMIARGPAHCEHCVFVRRYRSGTFTCVLYRKSLRVLGDPNGTLMEQKLQRCRDCFDNEL